MHAPPASTDHRPVERIPGIARPWLLTVEHASNALPPWIHADARDAAFLDDHWGWDPGAAAVARDLAARWGAPAVLCGTSRLVCDANRDPSDPTWIVDRIEGEPVRFNAIVKDALNGPAERARRLASCDAPYHAAVDAEVGAQRAGGAPVALLSIHTFTPVFRGVRRPMEVGVLFDDWEPLAVRAAAALASEGFETALNEPYSGRAGLIYSAARHGRAHAIPYLEIEVRQDLLGAGSSDFARICAGLDRVFRGLAPRAGDGP